MSVRESPAETSDSDVRTGVETVTGEDGLVGAKIHARVIAEKHDCNWCGGDLDGRAVEGVDGPAKASVTCTDCGRDFV